MVGRGVVGKSLAEGALTHGNAKCAKSFRQRRRWTGAGNGKGKHLLRKHDYD